MAKRSACLYKEPHDQCPKFTYLISDPETAQNISYLFSNISWIKFLKTPKCFSWFKLDSESESQTFGLHCIYRFLFGHYTWLHVT